MKNNIVVNGSTTYTSQVTKAEYNFGWTIDRNKKLTLKPSSRQWNLTPSVWTVNSGQNHNLSEFYLTVACFDNSYEYYQIMYPSLYGDMDMSFYINTTFTPTPGSELNGGAAQYWGFSESQSDGKADTLTKPLAYITVYNPYAPDLLTFASLCYPSVSSNNINVTNATLNTGYDSNLCDRVSCKLYKEGTATPVKTLSKSTSTTVTFDNLTPNTNYIAIFTYSNNSNDDYSYDNFIEFTTLNKGKPSPPAAPSVEDRTTTSITLGNVDGCEYREENTTWQGSRVFNGLSPNTSYTFYQRYEETPTEYASDSSSGTTVTTLSDIISVSINDNGSIKSGQLFANPNNDSSLKGVIDIYYKDENNNWVKI